MFHTDLFIKLGQIQDKDGRPLDGEQTVRIYMQTEQEKGPLWWDVSSLPRGMSPRRLRQYQQGMAEGQKLHLYFLIHNAHYDNEIAFRARVLAIRSASEPMPCPEPRQRPDCFASGRGACWLQLAEFREETDRKAADFIIASSGLDLSWAVRHSQYKFGYIELK